MTLTQGDIQKIVEVLEENNKKLATKEDLKNLKLALKSDIRELRLELKTDINELRGDVQWLMENTVKYSDIAELFESFEEKIKGDIMEEIILIKKHLNL